MLSVDGEDVGETTDVDGALDNHGDHSGRHHSSLKNVGPHYRLQTSLRKDGTRALCQTSVYFGIENNLSSTPGVSKCDVVMSQLLSATVVMTEFTTQSYTNQASADRKIRF